MGIVKDLVHSGRTAEAAGTTPGGLCLILAPGKIDDCRGSDGLDFSGNPGFFSFSPLLGESMHASPNSQSRRWGGVQRPSGHLGCY